MTKPSDRAIAQALNESLRRFHHLTATQFRTWLLDRAREIDAEAQVSDHGCSCNDPNCRYDAHYGNPLRPIAAAPEGAQGAVAMYQVRPLPWTPGGPYGRWREVSQREFDACGESSDYSAARWERRKLYTQPPPMQLDSGETDMGVRLLFTLWASFYDNKDGRFGDPKDWLRRLRAHIKAAAPAVEVDEAKPLSEYHEDFGVVVWWRFPVCEPAWIGTPNDDDWPGYHTHWTPHPPVPTLTAALGREGG